MIFLVLGSNLTGMVSELSGNEVGSKLEFVEYLTPKRIGLGVTGDRSATGGELHNGVIVALFVVDGPSRSTCGSDYLLGHLTFDIVIILHGIDDYLGAYDLPGKGDVRLGSTDDFAFLIFIIILFFTENVNRADDIIVTVVDIEKLRTS